MCDARPEFRTADEYIAHVESSLLHGTTPWRPVRAAEQDAVDRHFPGLDLQWRPADPSHDLTGLPEGFDVPQFNDAAKSYDPHERERFLRTLIEYEDFRLAVAHQLQGAGQ